MVSVPVAIGTVIVAVLAIFMNYPLPPISPIVFQWRSSGQYLDFNGHQVFFKVNRGNGTNGTLLCLHGFPTSSFDWYKMLPDLTRRFENIVLLDFLGLGFSDKPRHHDYTVTEQADIVEKLLKHLSIQKAHILAHDYGDTVAQELLARMLEGSTKVHCASVCLLNGGIFPSHHFPLLIQKFLRVPILRTIISRFGNFFMFERSIRKIFGPTTQPSSADLHDFWTLIRHNEGYRVLPNLLTYIDQRIANEDRLIGALQKTPVKVHMLYGTLDPINPAPFANHYRELIPNPDIVELNNVGHYPQLEAPEKVIQSYFKFLDNLNKK